MLEDCLLWSALWAPWMPADAEDGHWDWTALIELALAFPERFCSYSLLADNELQGLRFLEVSEDDVAALGTHAMRLSTAPWNRPPERRYRGVGSLLVAAAILRSQADGHGGQVHGASLPEAEAFHQANGVLRIETPDRDHLARYRFTEGTANAYIERLKAEGYIP